jgi:hypothetical protein
MGEIVKEMAARESVPHKPERLSSTDLKTMLRMSSCFKFSAARSNLSASSRDVDVQRKGHPSKTWAVASGQLGLINNLHDDCCVEVSCLVNGNATNHPTQTANSNRLRPVTSDKADFANPRVNLWLKGVIKKKPFRSVTFEGSWGDGSWPELGDGARNKLLTSPTRGIRSPFGPPQKGSRLYKNKTQMHWKGLLFARCTASRQSVLFIGSIEGRLTLKDLGQLAGETHQKDVRTAFVISINASRAIRSHPEKVSLVPKD